jgi:pimeloyl-ACP methyl ester carboxylesterase
VRYFEAGSAGPALLMVHGFGVGAYHYEQQLQQLSKQQFRVFSIDLLGQGEPGWCCARAAQRLGRLGRGGAHCAAQTPRCCCRAGKSWPDAAAGNAGSAGSEPAEAQQREKLFLSIDTWTQQLQEFLMEVVGEPAYLVGARA